MKVSKHWKSAMKMLQFWADLFHLGEWQLNVNEESMVETSGNCGNCNANTRCMSAVISLDSKMLNSDDLNQVEDTVIHEMVHILLTPFREAAEDRYTSPDVLLKEEERAVLQLERAFAKLKRGDA